MKKLVLVFLLVVSFAYSSDVKGLEDKCEKGESIVPCDLAAEAYFYGEGAEKDYSKALKFFKKACDGGLYNACFNLGAMHEEGYGVKSDVKTAMKFYELSCEGDFGEACEALAQIYEKEKDGQKTIFYREKGYKFGAWLSCEFMAKFYEEKDKQTSADYYKKACEYGKERARGQILPVGAMKIKAACDKAEEF